MPSQSRLSLHWTTDMFSIPFSSTLQNAIKILDHKWIRDNEYGTEQCTLTYSAGMYTVQNAVCSSCTAIIKNWVTCTLRLLEYFNFLVYGRIISSFEGRRYVWLLKNYLFFIKIQYLFPWDQRTFYLWQVHDKTYIRFQRKIKYCTFKTPLRKYIAIDMYFSKPMAVYRWENIDGNEIT